MGAQCQRCKSTRVASISGKSSDMNTTRIADKRDDGYVPYDMGIGGGDYIKLEFCLDCGQLQGAFPLPPTELEE